MLILSLNLRKFWAFKSFTHFTPFKSFKVLNHSDMNLPSSVLTCNKRELLNKNYKTVCPFQNSLVSPCNSRGSVEKLPLFAPLVLKDFEIGLTVLSVQILTQLPLPSHSPFELSSFGQKITTENHSLPKWRQLPTKLEAVDNFLDFCHGVIERCLKMPKIT